MASTSGRSNHWWGPGQRPAVDDFECSCRHCGLVQRETWLLDDLGRVVVGLVWLRPDGTAVAIRPFAHHKSRKPSVMPTQSWAERYPRAPVAGSPQCPKTPEGWAT